MYPPIHCTFFLNPLAFFGTFNSLFRLTLKVGTIHHQLKYKDDEEKMVNEESVCGEETPMLEEKQLEIPRKFQTVIEVKTRT